MSKDKDPPQDKSKPKRKFMGFSEQWELRQQKRARRTKPQPWILRKLTIGIVFGLGGYTFYVYIARFCLPMIRSRSGAQGSRAMGSE